MNLWTALLDVLILLLAALVLGALCERFKQSSILGYLLAGTLLGPNALARMPNHTAAAPTVEAFQISRSPTSQMLTPKFRRARSISGLMTCRFCFSYLHPGSRKCISKLLTII